MTTFTDIFRDISSQPASTCLRSTSHMWTQVPSNAAADRELGPLGSLNQPSRLSRPSRWRDPNFWIQVALFVATAVFLTLFVVYAVRNAEARSCRLTYSDDAAISEAQMRDWAADAGWPLTHPVWSDETKACVCDADPTPSLAPGSRKTPAWIAPGDVISLYPNGPYPATFRTLATGPEAYAPTEHVKVCLESDKLAQLWNGVDASGDPSGPLHCHAPGSEPGFRTRFQIYTGWDGDLYCTATDIPNVHKLRWGYYNRHVDKTSNPYQTMFHMCGIHWYNYAGQTYCMALKPGVPCTESRQCLTQCNEGKCERLDSETPSHTVMNLESDYTATGHSPCWCDVPCPLIAGEFCWTTTGKVSSITAGCAGILISGKNNRGTVWCVNVNVNTNEWTL